jgi:hypothetical protein
MIAATDMVVGGPESVFLGSVLCLLGGVAIKRAANPESLRWRLVGRILIYLGGAVAAPAGVVLIIAYF